MGGRITEMFDFLNREPMLTPKERDCIYCSFGPDKKDKSVRIKILNKRKKLAKNRK